MEKIYKNVADMIFAKESFKFGAFKLKLHEEDPDAPLSPFYINLRDKNNPKPGPLVIDDYVLIAKCIFKAIIGWGDDMIFDAIAGIPRAGDPIVKAMMLIDETTDINQGDYRIIQLAKEEDGEKRRIVPLPGFEYRDGERVLLVDDLVTGANTKLEAIKAIESSGSKVVGLVVLVDRQQGGREQLKKAGYRLISCFTIRELFGYYKATGKISGQKYWECIDYINNN
ncbi:hypothetical protein KAR28_01120 [Candidatus Parcubacteria bacterium]|nr:hypothetical protein [Candidatus Parcubacteria bacterium]